MDSASEKAGLRAGRRFRVTRREEVSRLFKRGGRAGDGLVTLLMLPNGLTHARVVVAVSARHGPAARRNRIKRLCREAFRLARASLPAGWDYAIVPRVAAATTVEGLQASLKALASRLAERQGRSQ